MTDISIIQDARDVLAKWRDAAKFEALHVANYAPAHPEKWGAWTEPDRRGWSPVGPLLNGPDSLALLVGTAGNPELLDAIDTLLGVAVIEAGENVHFDHVADRLAAAIIAADERMSVDG